MSTFKLLGAFIVFLILAGCVYWYCVKHARPEDGYLSDSWTPPEHKQ